MIAAIQRIGFAIPRGAGWLVASIFGPSLTEGLLDVRTYEDLIFEILHETEPVSLNVLIDRVVSEAIVDELQAGAWVSDAGIWGPSLIRGRVLQVIRSMLGRTLVLEPEGENSCLVVPFFAH